jgi:MYXO-CTERM domain-containing protein
MNKHHWGLFLGASLLLGSSVAPSIASACGGFFCSQTQGVNQAAERIVFANNGDGTVTAAIEIQYQGPAEKFSWLLPISSVPMGDEIAVGSTVSFQRLQQATNPQYFLTTRVEGRCDQEPVDDDSFAEGGASSGPSAAGGEGPGSDGGVTVEASGLVGSFEWAVISLDQNLPEPGDAAVTWLGDNGYDVPQGAPGLLGPYLADGMYLLALRLQKGATAGSIRPIVLTYDAAKPMIPIKLTAVAANDDMGVLTWVLGEHQAVPQNYYALELNEARINWFNPNAGYNDVVIAAANEAGGQGFVTEYAQPGSDLQGTVWFDFEQEEWEFFKDYAPNLDPSELVVEAIWGYSQWDGFWDVIREQVTLPPDITIEDVQDCPECNTESYEVSPNFLAALEQDVIEPARVIQGLLDASTSVTRLYSTLSAAEMTVDPLFTFNPDLDPISNVHSAERIIECEPGYYEWEAPWRIELPQGGVVRGGPDDVGRWPADFADLPANRRILRAGESGAGKVLEDNSATIDEAITAYSNTVPKPPHHLKVPMGRGDDVRPPGSPLDADGDGRAEELYATGGCGCRVAQQNGSVGLLLGFVGLGLFGFRRRRR